MQFETPGPRTEEKYGYGDLRRRSYEEDPTKDRVRLSLAGLSDRSRNIGSGNAPIGRTEVEGFQSHNLNPESSRFPRPMKSHYEKLSRQQPPSSASFSNSTGQRDRWQSTNTEKSEFKTPLLSPDGRIREQPSVAPFSTPGNRGLISINKCTQCGTAIEQPTNQVVVYGYPHHRASTVINHFQKHADIIKRLDGPGNWTILTYYSPLHAEMALRQNGTIIDGDLMIGVQRPTTELLKNVSTFSSDQFVLHGSSRESFQERTEMDIGRSWYEKERERQPYRTSLWTNIKDYIFNW